MFVGPIHTLFYPSIDDVHETVDKVKNLLTPSEWLLIGSAFAATSAGVILGLQAVGDETYTEALPACMVAAVVLLMLGLMSRVEPVGEAVEGVRPLRNESGSDCFINAAFQVIMHDEPLKEVLLDTYKSEDSPKAIALCQAIEQYTKGGAVSTHDLRLFMSHDQQSGHQDAHEFMQNILNRVTFNEHPRMFLKTCTQITYLKNNQEETKKTEETLSFLILSVPAQSMSGQVLIDSHYGASQEYEAAWTDDDGVECKGTASITKFEQAPQQLAIVLKRFDKDNEKITTKIDMPEVLQLMEKTYILKKMIVHQGTTGGGHYHALLKQNEKWIRASDTRVSEETNSERDREEGYMYFYDLQQPVQEPSYILISQVNEEQDQQNKKGDDPSLHGFGANGSSSEHLDDGKQNVPAVEDRDRQKI